MITKLNILVILTICNICIWQIFWLLLFCIDSIVDSTMHIMVCLSSLIYVMYNIKIIYVYKIRCLQQNMRTITVDFPQMNI